MTRTERETVKRLIERMAQLEVAAELDCIVAIATLVARQVAR